MDQKLIEEDCEGIERVRTPVERIGRYQSGVESSCVPDLSDHGVTPVVGQTTGVLGSN